MYILLFNEPGFLFDQSHMWYMPALIYVLAIGLLVEKYKLHRAAYVAAALLTAVCIAAEWRLYTLDIRRSCYTRNFLLDGLPYFYMGQMLKRYENKLLPVITKKLSVLLSLVCALCLLVEVFVLRSWGMSLNRTAFIFLMPLSLSIFTLLINFPSIGKKSAAAVYARDASMVIYIIHHMVEEVLKLTAQSFFGIALRDHVFARYFLILTFSGLIGFGYAVLRSRGKTRIAYASHATYLS